MKQWIGSVFIIGWGLGWMAPGQSFASAPADKAPPAAAGASAAKTDGTVRYQAVPPLMQKYAENLAVLLLNIGALEQTPAEESKKAVLDALAQLKAMSHTMQSSVSVYTVDPIMPYLTLDVAAQFARVEAAYLSGNRLHARYLLRQTTQACMGCHAAATNKNSARMQFPEPAPQISELEKAAYYSATRRHEEAILAYERYLKDPNLKIAQPALWQDAMEDLLALTIRLRQSSSTTLEMISAILQEGGYTPEQSELLKVWRMSAKSWSQEKLNPGLQGEALFAKAQALAAAGDSLASKGPKRGYIEWMRVMGLINELSRSQASEAIKAEGYRLAGEVSGKLKGNLAWMHPEAYFEACIRLKPHSPLAQSCALKLEEQGADGMLSAEKVQQLKELAR